MPVIVMKEILRTAKAPKEYMEAANLLLCRSCDITSGRKQTLKSSLLSMRYAFNDTIGVDAIDLHDCSGQC